LLSGFLHRAPLQSDVRAGPAERTNDPVIARTYEHFREAAPPFVRAVSAEDFPRPIWNRVKRLVAFRLHRPRPDGSTVADAAIYLVRDSDLYRKALAALTHDMTSREYVWCLLAAVLAHEAAHAVPLTERAALIAEANQLRRCLWEGHLFSADGWSALSYLGKVEAKLRNPREHY
jgi:hypothetical protein